MDNEYKKDFTIGFYGQVSTAENCNNVFYPRSHPAHPARGHRDSRFVILNQCAK